MTLQTFPLFPPCITGCAALIGRSAGTGVKHTRVRTVYLQAGEVDDALDTVGAQVQAPERVERLQGGRRDVRDGVGGQAQALERRQPAQGLRQRCEAVAAGAEHAELAQRRQLAGKTLKLVEVHVQFAEPAPADDVTASLERPRSQSNQQLGRSSQQAKQQIDLFAKND